MRRLHCDTTTALEMLLHVELGLPLIIPVSLMIRGMTPQEAQAIWEMIS